MFFMLTRLLYYAKIYIKTYHSHNLKTDIYTDDMCKEEIKWAKKELNQSG